MISSCKVSDDLFISLFSSSSSFCTRRYYYSAGCSPPFKIAAWSQTVRVLFGQIWEVFVSFEAVGIL